MNAVFTRRLEDRPTLTLNHKLQPVAENSKIRAEFSSFLGAIARECVPLDHVSWLAVPEEEKNGLWEFIKVKNQLVFYFPKLVYFIVITILLLDIFVDKVHHSRGSKRLCVQEYL